MYTFALAGNPNCGKTTMFNEITGSTQHVGNWPGVTVEKKEGKARRFKENIKIVDLPGIYSLSPYSMEEIIARDYIIEEKPDVIINIIDASNIERNLYLTTQIMELGIPTILALNMMDVVQGRGDHVDIKSLESKIGIPVIPLIAAKGKGVQEAVEKALEIAQTAATTDVIAAPMIEYHKTIEQGISIVEKLVGSYIDQAKENVRWISLKLLEGDFQVKEKVVLPESVQQEIQSCIQKIENEFGMDMETVIADQRYGYIADLVGKTVKKSSSSGHLTLSDKIDKVATHRIFSIPIFLAAMFMVFQITFGALGSFTIDLVDGWIGSLAETVSGGLAAAGAAPWLHALIGDGIIGGLGSMLVFVPQIMILFFFLALLEDSGYMARVAFIMDRMLRRLGISGKAFIPMIMGFGCSVPAIMATRTLENDKDRKMTIILSPFMSCGARLPVYALFTSVFFTTNQSLVIFSLYLLGIVVAILSGLLLKNTVLKGDTTPFIMELPPYRIPTLKGLAIHMGDCAKGFIKKAGTVIFAAAVVIWFFQSFNFSLQMVDNPGESILGSIGHFLAPIFAPLGFGDWQSSVALLTGLVAKEVVVSTFGILHGLGEVAEASVQLQTILQSYYTPLKAYAFMVFTLLYFPCIAALGAMKREFNSWKWTWLTVGYQTAVAWIMAFLVYQVGRIIGL